MRTLFAMSLTLSLVLCSCMPGGPGTSVTGTVSTAEVGTVLPATLPPAGFTPPPAPSLQPPTPIPTLPGGASPTGLKYRVLQEYPGFFFCDPDLYPIPVDDETLRAFQRFSEIQANADEFQAILNHNGLTGLASFTDAQKLLIYREHKKLGALVFEKIGNKYNFQLQASDPNQQGSSITGSIDGQGNIQVQSRTSAILTCPICLSFGTRIDTPRGSIPVQDLRPGDLVWTLNAAGLRVSARLLESGHVPVSPEHRLVHILLDDGRGLLASPGHPAAGGRRLGDIRPGDSLDGARVLSLHLVPYSGRFTYDILPAGDTGFYWANGILLASTLAK